MKLRNILLGAGLLVLLATPSFTYAVWWNPLTWFQKPAVTVPISEATTNLSLAETVSEAAPEKPSVSVLTTKPAEMKWWNPASWFRKPDSPFPTSSVASTTTAEASTPPGVATPSVKKEMASAKPEVSPQVKVTDQSVEIEKLRKEVEELKKSQTRITGFSESLKPVAPQSFNPIPHIETWEEQETRDFLYADQRGWTSLTSTNAMGEKRYYRKEGTQWVRKNSEAEAQQPYYIDTVSAQLQRTIEFLESENARDLARQKEIDEETKPFYDELSQKGEEWRKKCINPDGSMPFLSGQRATECDKISLDQIVVQNKINAITGIYPSTAIQTSAPLRTPQGWIVNRTTKTISTPDGTSKYYYFCTSGECRINPY